MNGSTNVQQRGSLKIFIIETEKELITFSYVSVSNIYPTHITDKFSINRNRKKSINNDYSTPIFTMLNHRVIVNNKRDI